MGVIALGIGFATPLALAGVAVHIAGHAVAKALGFYAATPLLGHDPSAAAHAVTGIARTQPALGATMGISLGALAGLPPSPLFVSEVLIVAGGFQAGRTVGRGCDRAPARARLPRARARAARDDRRRGAEPRPSCAGPARRRRARRRLGRAAPRARRRGGRLPGSDIVDALCEGIVVSAYRERSPPRSPSGWRFAGLHASADGSCVRTLLAPRRRTFGSRRVDVADGRVPSIVDLAPAAGWDEREAHDLHGVEFAGHEPLRPLVDHDLDLAHWTVPVRGDDPYQVAVGPIHAGVIESGHFRFHVVGERILHLDARLFYKHRGLERAAEGATLDDGIALRLARLRRLRRHERASPTRTPARTRSVSFRRRSSPACGRSCSSSSGCGATSTTSPPSARASGSPRATTVRRARPSGRGGSTPRSPATGSSSAAFASAAAH